jgi:DUF3102 family protein
MMSILSTQPAVARPPTEAELVARVRTKYQALAGAVGDFVKRAIEFGEFLNEERPKFKHGKWIEWLESQCGVPRSAANRCQQLAEPENKAKIEAAMAKLPDPTGLSLNKAVALIKGPSKRPPSTVRSDSYDSYQNKLIEKLKGMTLETAKATVADTSRKLKQTITDMEKVVEAQN